MKRYFAATDPRVLDPVSGVTRVRNREKRCARIQPKARQR